MFHCCFALRERPRLEDWTMWTGWWSFKNTSSCQSLSPLLNYEVKYPQGDWTKRLWFHLVEGCSYTFGFEGKVAVFTGIRTNVGVRPDVLFQHARLLAANATFFTYVLPPATASHVDVLFIGLEPETETGTKRFGCCHKNLTGRFFFHLQEERYNLKIQCLNFCFPHW